MSNEKNEIESEKSRLLEKRDELRARLEAIRKDVRRGLEADFEERAIQLENDEVLAGIAKATAAELESIEERLARLA
jgi:RNA polymerase-binding transcription factor DksA